MGSMPSVCTSASAHSRTPQLRSVQSHAAQNFQRFLLAKLVIMNLAALLNHPVQLKNSLCNIQPISLRIDFSPPPICGKIQLTPPWHVDVVRSVRGSTQLLLLTAAPSGLQNVIIIILAPLLINRYQTKKTRLPTNPPI